MKTKNLLDIEQFKQIFSYIAIFIELKNLNEYLLNESFLIFIYNSISQIKLNMTLEQFEYTLNLGKYLFLFDGLDEVDPSIMHNAENELKSFINKYEKVIIISTQLRFEDLNIKAELLIFTTDNSILFIKEKLNKILDEL